MSEQPVIRIRGLCASSQRRILIRDLDLDIFSGELLGIVGESGSGKTMLVRSLLNIPPEDVTVRADCLEIFGQDCLHVSPADWRRISGRYIGFIPQNTIAYLHPMMKIRHQIVDSFVAHGLGDKKEALKRAELLLREVGLAEPQRILNAYAWELSGGMRQRVNIALALMNRPQLLIADEPTTALDAAIQRQVMELFRRIHEETGIALVLISHDLSMLQHYSQKTMVMYAGRMVEYGSTDTLFHTPGHPYTEALRNVMPTLRLDPNERLAEIPGFVPDSGRESDHCIFAPRCRYRTAACDGVLQLQQLAQGHLCRCARPLTGGDSHG